MNFSTMIFDIFNVLLAGLVLGAGLPALFALGIRLASGTGRINPDGTVTHTQDATPLQKFLAWLCFAVIIFMIVAGILWITKSMIYHTFAIDIFGTESAS